MFVICCSPQKTLHNGGGKGVYTAYGAPSPPAVSSPKSSPPRRCRGERVGYCSTMA